jgi:lysophospholipase L1-like esterase
MNFYSIHFTNYVFGISLFLVLGFGSDLQAQETKSVQHSAEIRYLALGDSYTIGTGIDTLNNYPNQLSDSLLAQGYSVDTTTVIATNGWTTTDLIKGIEEQSPDSSYNLVSLLIGVNNQYQGLDLDLYRKEFSKLLSQAIALAGGDKSNVFVISIPNYGVTPFGQSRNSIIIRQELQVYNDIAKKITAEENISFVNITPISELAENDPSLLASDELHPSTKMYAMWITEMLPTITEILKHND